MINYKTDRCDLGYLPSDGEYLRAYIHRIKSIAQQNRWSFSPDHEKWWTHRNPAPCYICNFMDMLDYLIGCLENMQENDKNHLWRCYKDHASQDPLSFEFRPQKKR